MKSAPEPDVMVWINAIPGATVTCRYSPSNGALVEEPGVPPVSSDPPETWYQRRAVAEKKAGKRVWRDSPSRWAAAIGFA
jgi:hypothetical protein